jgi:hypothetical protein
MQKIIDWIVDYTHLIKGHGLMFIHHTPPSQYLGHIKEGLVPVIILPGIFGRWAFLKPLADHISLLGHPVYIVPKLGNNLGDIPTSSGIVRDLINEKRIQKAVIVAHSKGGLIGKYLLAHDNQDNAVTGFSNAGARQRFGDVVGRIGLLKALEKLQQPDDSIYIGDKKVDEYIR